MLKSLVVGAAISLVSMSAFAGGIDSPDTAVSPAMNAGDYRWSGFYLGGVGAYGWAEQNNSIDGSTVSDFDMEGWMGGATAGYNFQHGQYVFGFEADIMGGKIDGTGDAIDPTADFPSVPSGEIDWLGTARGRAGFLVDNTLLYATGGLAVGGVKGSLTNVTPFGDSDDRDTSGTKIGWVAGVGAEFALTGNVSAKIEYLYADLGEDSYTMTGPLVDVKFDGTTAVRMVRFGLNFKF